MTYTNKTKPIYIVLSQTGTFMSKLIRLYTGDEYNHVSLSLSPSLQRLYSFGRRKPYNPFIAGFVGESPNYGTFKRFPDTKVMVLALDVDEEKYSAITALMRSMFAEKEKYGYNYLGLGFAAFKIRLSFKNRYYCSEFLKEVLQRFDIEGAGELAPIPHPVHFINIPYARTVYIGRLSDYSLRNACAPS